MFDILTSALGAYWHIFAAFMVLNVADFLTGIAKAKYGNSENSNKGAKGVVKNWVIGCNIYCIFISYTFNDIGNIIEH